MQEREGLPSSVGIRLSYVLPSGRQPEGGGAEETGGGKDVPREQAAVEPSSRAQSSNDQQPRCFRKQHGPLQATAGFFLIVVDGHQSEVVSRAPGKWRKAPGRRALGGASMSLRGTQPHRTAPPCMPNRHQGAAAWACSSAAFPGHRLGHPAKWQGANRGSREAPSVPAFVHR